MPLVSLLLAKNKHEIRVVITGIRHRQKQFAVGPSLSLRFTTLRLFLRCGSETELIEDLLAIFDLIGDF